MAQKRVLMVGVRKQGKRWQITVEGTDRHVLTVMADSLGKAASDVGFTILGSNPLADIIDRPKRKAKKSNAQDKTSTAIPTDPPIGR